MELFKNIFSWMSKSFQDFWLLGYSISESMFSNSSIYKKYSHEQLLNMYKGWIFAASDAIWDWMAMLDWNLYKDDLWEEIINNDTLKLIDSKMIKAISIYLKTIWEVYILKIKVWNKVQSLKMLKSWNVVEKTNDLWDVLYYSYTDGTSFYKFNVEDIIAIKSFSPLFEQSWATPLKAAANQMAMDLASIEYNRLFFENWWKPWTVLKSWNKIDADVRDKYLRKWKENFVWLQNSNKVAFLDQWIEIEDFSANQKDMELTNQRTFTRDEILMMFRVWTPILWKSDWVWFADKKVPWYYLTQYALKPLWDIIADEFNTQLFEWEWYFKFEYPEDKDELLKEYQWNVITLNQYLVWTWRQPVKEWNRLWDWSELTPITKAEKPESAQLKTIKDGIWKIFSQKEFWTNEYNEKVWETKISRTDKYEDEVVKIQKKIFGTQEREILENLESWKSIKKITSEWDLFNDKKSKLLYITLYTKFFTEMMKKEWEVAIEEISEEAFAVARLNKWIWENIERMSKDIDDVTRQEIFEIVKLWNREWLWADAIAASIRAKFNQYTRKSWRVEKIARTEVTRASNKSQEEAYIQSEVVEEKEWFTAIDDRVAPECAILHWKRIKIWESFLKKWERDALWNKVTYETVDFPPRHVNCRCTLRPIISEKSAENVRNILIKTNKILKNNGINYGK